MCVALRFEPCSWGSFMQLLLPKDPCNAPSKFWKFCPQYAGYGGFPAERAQKSQVPTKLAQPFLTFRLFLKYVWKLSRQWKTKEMCLSEQFQKCPCHDQRRRSNININFPGRMPGARIFRKELFFFSPRPNQFMLGHFLLETQGIPNT